MEGNKFLSKIKGFFSNKRNIIIISATLIVAIIAIALFCTIFAITNMNNTKIIKGITINNIDVSEISKEEAIERINARSRTKKAKCNKTFKRRI